MISSILMPMTLVVVCGAGPVKADVYVAPGGSDANAGTRTVPLATIDAARMAVRKRIAKGLDSGVTVVIRGGTYLLDGPLVFGPEDSGTAEHGITYAAHPGETVVISGGRPVTGWKKADGGKWVARLPEVASGKLRFRQLFRDGVRLPRGRFPNGAKLLRVKRVSKDVKQIELPDAPIGGDLAGKGAELVMFQNWSISRGAIVSSSGKTVSLASPMGWIGHGSATTASPHKPCYLEHAPEFVDEPGEWYLDTRSGLLTYMASGNENPNEHKFVAGRIEQLVSVVGRPGAPVRNIHFRGLRFEHTAWSLPAVGYNGIQAGHHGTHMKKETYVLPSAIMFGRATDCGVSGCKISHTGSGGISFGAGCRRNKVSRCELVDIGGNGIVIGWRGNDDSKRIDFVGNASLSADWLDRADTPTANEISDCVIKKCGAVNHGCVAIFDAFCVGTRIMHNLVAEMPYSGISIGFRWDTSKTTQRDCLVANNHIHDCMKMLADGGGIYTLGLQPGTVLRGNLIHDIHRSGFAHGGAPNNGIFFDQGSKGYFVEGQITYRTSGKPIRFNQTNKGNLKWKDNHFGVAPDAAEFPKAAAKKAGPRPE